MKSFCILTTFLLLSTGISPAGVKGQAAPELKVDQWVNLPGNAKKGPTLKTDWKGKVVYLYFFQSWCPGCHSSGFPTLQALQKKYAKDDTVKFATVQTVFEGFGTNTKTAAEKIVKRYQLQGIPVGHSGSKGSRSKVMRDFKTRGTPWTVIIGKDGKVVFEGFHLKVEQGRKMIESLRAQS